MVMVGVFDGAVRHCKYISAPAAWSIIKSFHCCDVGIEYLWAQGCMRCVCAGQIHTSMLGLQLAELPEQVPSAQADGETLAGP